MTGEFQIIFLKIYEAINKITPSIYFDWNFWIAIVSAILAVITLVYLIKYVGKTEELAIQARDTNLRPVILRAGVIPKREDLEDISKESELEKQVVTFQILKNIATSISGYIIINKKKYELYFNYERMNIGNYVKQWGRMDKNTIIYAILTDKKDSKEANQIIIQYKDIEGNAYYTIENENFDQKSFKGNI